MLPTPPITPLERLQVQDGLLINAERWQRSHNYHRQRQNIHYQSLHQPGIVCGLGVSLINTPKDVPSQYDDQRWLQIKPGIAIDAAGNPIIVNQPIDFHLAAEITEDTPQIIYIVVSYVDPESLQRKSNQEYEIETFRIDEKSTPPTPYEVELCRILLRPGTIPLVNAVNVFEPGLNSLDFRYRQIVRSRPTQVIRAAYLQADPLERPYSRENLGYLLQSVGNLTHHLQGYEEIDQLSFPLEDAHAGSNYDLLFTRGSQPISFTPKQTTILKNYLDAGGVLLMETPTDALDRIESIMNLCEQWEIPLEDIRKLDRHHPIRTQPFLFAALPVINQQPMQIAIAGGIVLVIGDLSLAWGLDEKLIFSRETIRSAQELGINILNFAWSRRNMTQLGQKYVPPSTKSDALKNVLNKLDL
ncbi:MAG TPA: DUF4159 domain-containing protein [Nostocaceae cyanobacterium]|nr:DUF4159 domain-containing protein [Nostocaceae cyanobacterium]